MAENKIANLLDSLCERPFADDPQSAPVHERRVAQPQPARLDLPPRAREGTAGEAGAPKAAAPITAASMAAAPMVAASMASGELAAILSGTATPAQVEAFHQAAADSDALRLEAQSALAFVDGIEQAPLAAPAFLVQQALPAAPLRIAAAAAAPARVAIAVARKPDIWSRFLPRRQVAAACAVLLMASGLTWSVIRHEMRNEEALPPLPAASAPGDRAGPGDRVGPGDRQLDDGQLDALVRSKAPASAQVPMSAPAPGAEQALPSLAPTGAPDAIPAPAAAPAPALPPTQALANPCAPGAGARREVTLPAVSQLAERPAAGPAPKAATAPAADPGCPAEEGRTLMQSTAAAPETPETSEQPRNQKSERVRTNRAASRKAAAEHVRPSAPTPAATRPAPAASQSVR